MSKTHVVEKWVDEAATLTKPSKFVWADGSKQEYDRLVEEMLRDGTLLEMNQKIYPGCFLHRSQSGA
jgi:phosphoenolpyruvate carboxykinase (GTP)